MGFEDDIRRSTPVPHEILAARRRPALEAATPAALAEMRSVFDRARLFLLEQGVPPNPVIRHELTEKGRRLTKSGGLFGQKVDRVGSGWMLMGVIVTADGALYGPANVTTRWLAKGYFAGKKRRSRYYLEKQYEADHETVYKLGRAVGYTDEAGLQLLVVGSAAPQNLTGELIYGPVYATFSLGQSLAVRDDGRAVYLQPSMGGGTSEWDLERSIRSPIESLLRDCGLR